MLTVTEYLSFKVLPQQMPRPTYGAQTDAPHCVTAARARLLTQPCPVPSPSGAHLSILEHVWEPQCVGINAHLVGDHVRVGLHREHHLGLSRRAMEPQGTLLVYTM